MQEQGPRTVRSPRTRRISIFDGQDLKKALMAGAAWLEENRDAINALNVFPVPDGDTGSNMSATMQAAIRGIAGSEETSAGVIAAKVSQGALMGARGNSGVILSQVLRGLALGLDKKQTFTAPDLAMALEEASRLARRAVLKPVEGTILTVVRDSAEAARISADHGDDLIRQMQEIVSAARQSVARTPDLLPMLKQAGVVDAGGQGLCTILEGVWHYIRGEAPSPGLDGASRIQSRTLHAEPAQKKGRVKIEEEFGYEVVFLLRGDRLDVEGIQQAIIDMGGVSTVVAGDEKMLKVHTHTEWPGKILDYGVGLGSLLDINIENLQEQSLAYAAESEAEHAGETRVFVAEAPAHSIATVAVTAGAGFEKVFQGLGVSAIVPGGQTMNPSIEELLAAVEAVAAAKVIILPNNSNVILSARQVPDLTTKEVRIIPTETIPQGIAALMGFNYDADLDGNCQVMTGTAQNIQTVEITTAVRTVHVGGVRVREGDFIGLVNGNLSVADQNLDGVVDETLRRMDIDRYEVVTLYYGEDASPEEAQSLARRLKEKHSHLEIEVVDGGQPYYTYILSAE